MSVFFQKSKEWRLRFRYCLSVDHSEMLKGMVQGRAVLDIGDRKSPFFARLFAAGATRWVMVGRLPPLSLFSTPPENVVVTNAQFTPELGLVPASEIGLILFSFPSPKYGHDAVALRWATREHLVVFLSDASDDRVYGSPDFWQVARGFETEVDSRDKISRVRVMRRKKPIHELAPSLL